MDFNVFLSKAYEMMAANTLSANPEQVTEGFGTLDGKIVKFSKGDEGKFDFKSTRQSFIEAAVAKFGEEFRKDIERFVNPSADDCTKPLSARTILAVDKYMQGSTETVKRLSDILNRAAAADVAPVSTDELDVALAEIDPKLARAYGPDLDGLQGVAQAKFEVFLGMTGDQIATGMRTKDSIGMRCVQEAIKAQLDLADKLTELAGKLSSGCEAVEALRDRALARATEINCVALELADISERRAKNEAVDARSEQKLNETAAKLLPEKALSMHGNDEAIAAVEKNLAPLMCRVAAIKAGAESGTGVNFSEAKKIIAEIDLAKSALNEAAKDGIKYDNGVWRPNAKFLESVVKMLDETAADVHALTDNFVRKALECVKDQYIYDFTNVKLLDEKSMSPRCAEFFAEYKDEISAAKKMAKAYADLRTAMDRLCANPTRDNLKALSSAVDAVEKTRKKNAYDISSCNYLITNLNILFGHAKGKMSVEIAQKIMSFSPDESKELEDIARELAPDRLGTLIARVDPLARMLERCKYVMNVAGNGPEAKALESDKLLDLAVKGKLPLATVVGARAWGATEDMVDIDITDANLVSCVPLGAGEGNEVFKCTYRFPDGTEKNYVFKGEREGQVALGSLQGGKCGYSNLQSVVHLNAASRKAAVLLGTPNIVVDARVGCLHNRFGLFMELAPGASFDDINKKDKSLSNKNLIGKNKPNLDFGSASKYAVVGKVNGNVRRGGLGDKEFRKLAGNFMRAGSDLEWNDWLTGQTDRHYGNYLVNIGKDQSVSLKAIDNDMAFPDWRLGMTKFRAYGRQLKNLIEFLAKDNFIEKPTYDAFKKAYGNHEAFQFADDGSVVIDLSKVREITPQMKLTFGFQVLAKPVAISRRMYDRLMRLAEEPESLRQSMAPHMSEAALDAMIVRLQEMVEHARELERRGRVLDDAQWQNYEMQDRLESEQTVQDYVGSDRYRYKADFYDSGIYVRDFAATYKRPLPEMQGAQNG